MNELDELRTENPEGLTIVRIKVPSGKPKKRKSDGRYLRPCTILKVGHRSKRLSKKDAKALPGSAPVMFSASSKSMMKEHFPPPGKKLWVYIKTYKRAGRRWINGYLTSQQTTVDHDV